MVGDEERAIVDALNALRHRFTYVFTTGGIGPTHADITADCVAKAFGVSIESTRERMVTEAGTDSATRAWPETDERQNLLHPQLVDNHRLNEDRTLGN